MLYLFKHALEMSQASVLNEKQNWWYLLFKTCTDQALNEQKKILRLDINVNAFKSQETTNSWSYGARLFNLMLKK